MTRTSMTNRNAFPQGGGFPRSRTPVRPKREDQEGSEAQRLADVLGWFSIGLGLTSLAAPEEVARFIGTEGDAKDRKTLRLVGLQELICGIGILGTRRPAGWVWARVAGDVVHLALLGTAMTSKSRHPGRLAATTATIAAITALDAYDAIQLTQQAEATGGGLRGGPFVVRQSITVNRPAEELYRFWRDFENLPRIMSHLESVQVTGERTSHWKAKAPAGLSVEWDAELTDYVTNKRLAWRSVSGQVNHSGSVQFVPAPGGRGTEVHVELWYDPPGGVIGRWFAQLFGEEPGQQVYDDLRHFKQVMETGEVVRSESSDDGTHLLQRPAQPVEMAASR